MIRCPQDQEVELGEAILGGEARDWWKKVQSG